MPYISSRYTDPPAEDRDRLDPHIFALVDKMKQAKNYDDLNKLSPFIARLAQEIKSVAEGYEYEGAFAGELNYSLHRIFLQMLPATRYWVMALDTGWLHRVAWMFSGFKLSDILKVYTSDRSLVSFGKPATFKHITEWVLVQIACLAAPEDSRDVHDWISGVFIHIDTEFYRRVSALYEEVQILKSGDLPEYEELIKVLCAQHETLLKKRTVS